VKFEGEHAETVFAKNLFLNNKKNKAEIFYVVVAHDTKVDMKGLEKHLKVGSSNLRGADEEVMNSILGAKKGSLNIFSIMNDK
jgi:hypothetical protein